MLRALSARWARRWRRSGPHHELGTRGEVAAEKFLQKQGYRVLARNAKTPKGEIDLVLEDRQSGMVLFVEVKSRSFQADSAFRGERAVDGVKRRRLIAIAQHLRMANGWLERPTRIDIVVVEFQGSETRIRHLVDAVRGR